MSKYQIEINIERIIIVMNTQLAALITLLMIASTTTSSSAAKFPIAKPGCPDHCGEVEIPFPFGIGESCYLDRRFEVECFTNSSSDLVAPPVPFWVRVNTTLSITNIAFEGYFGIMMFVRRTCYNEFGPVFNTSSPTTINLAFQGFTINSTSNMFFVIGCDDIGAFSGSNYTGGRVFRNGCMTYCSNSTEDVRNDSCEGIGCCQTKIPPGQSKLAMVLGTYDNHAKVLEKNPCGYAFVTDKEHFKFYSANLHNLQTLIYILGA